MLVQLNTWAVVCGSDLQRGIVVMAVGLSLFCLNMKVVGDIVYSELDQGTTHYSMECCSE